ncbi:MAG: hypothetical protein KJZ65_03495 [Phycisphaerales bacterium]|nr:hypothetical protein [Phycisphaerales bacterium]
MFAHSRSHGAWTPMAILAILAGLSGTAAAVPPANDHCATPQSITGTGYFIFNNCEATTGAEGQNNAGCQGAAGDSTIYNDLWYCWTAPCTGLATVSTCMLTLADTKIAVYNGCGCPVAGTGPLNCDDNACDLQSRVTFEVVCGQQYMIQIGSGIDQCWQGEFFVNCEGEPCPPPTDCEDCCGVAPQFTGFPGTVAVLTQQAAPAFSAVEVIDISNQGAAPLNSNWWAATFYSWTNPTNWSQAELGTVFGVCLDAQGNIYVAHTAIYGNSNNQCGGFIQPGDALGSLSANTANPAGRPGAIYKIDTNSGVASFLTSLPNASDPAYIGGPYPTNGSESYPGLGNMAYDCGTDNLYVSNFEDGRIYRLNTTGTALSTYRHATGAVVAGGAPMPGDAPGWIPRERHPNTGRGQRVWAVQPHQGRLYYSVWREDNCRPDATAGNEIWSIDLVDSGPNAGEFIPGTEQLEIPMSLYAYNGSGITGVSNPVSDLSFSPECCMLVGERSMSNDTISDAHESRLLEFCYDPAAQAWVPSTAVFGPGAAAAPQSCAGGVDYDFNTTGTVVNVWTTADFISPSPQWIYGLLGLPFTGGAAGVGTSLMIDADQDVSFHDKWSIGSTEISCSTPCGKLNDISIECVADEHGFTGCYDYTFTISNNSGTDVHYILIPDVNVNPQVIWLPTPIPSGGTSAPITIRICPPDGTADCYPIHFTLADRFIEECCAIDYCVPLPDCDCIVVKVIDVHGPSPDILNYSLTFTATNMTPDTLEHMFIVPEPPGAFTVSPAYIDIPTTLPGGTVGPYKLNIGTLAPNTTYSIRISVHDRGLFECCSKVVEFTTPDTNGVPDCPPDMNADGVLNFFDVQMFLNFFAAGDPRGDFNSDGQFNFFDVQSFLAAFSAGCP